MFWSRRKDNKIRDAYSHSGNTLAYSNACTETKSHADSCTKTDTFPSTSAKPFSCADSTTGARLR